MLHSNLNKYISRLHISRRTSLEYEAHVDGLRAIAITLVVGTHFGVLVNIGYLGVDIFFVISGFIISKSLLMKKQSFKDFLTLRLTRLAPVMYLLVCLATISHFLKLNVIPATIQGLVMSALWIKNLDSWGTGLDLLWTLSAEIQFYMIFGMIFLKWGH